MFGDSMEFLYMHRCRLRDAGIDAHTSRGTGDRSHRRAGVWRRPHAIWRFLGRVLTTLGQLLVLFGRRLSAVGEPHEVPSHG